MVFDTFSVHFRHPYWDAPEGKDFLALHDEKIKNGMTIHRIFLLKDIEVLSQKAIIQCQMERKIECRILLLDRHANSGISAGRFCSL
jgi:hypothetical protein